MAANLAEIREQVAPRIRDDVGRLSSWPAEDLDAAIASALSEFNRDVPRVVTVSVAGADTFDLTLSALGTAGPPSTQWAPGWSQVRDVIYPYVPTSRHLPHLEADSYGVVTLPAGEVLRLVSATPRTGDTLLVAFTRPHELTAAVSTVPVAARMSSPGSLTRAWKVLMTARTGSFCGVLIRSEGMWVVSPSIVRTEVSPSGPSMIRRPGQARL